MSPVDDITHTSTGRTYVVTGASDGVGRATAHTLAAAGATVVMIGRNEAKTAAAARAIMGSTGSLTVSWDVADLLRREALHELADRLRVRYPIIHGLVNNAGALFLDRTETVDGIESTFALNHLAYFSLSLLLLKNLAAAAMPFAPARIICVASRAHRDARLQEQDWQCARGYSGWRAYANSKLANVLFARELAARLDPGKIIVHAVHPGLVHTRFAVNNGRRGRLLRRIMDLRSISPEKGADSVVWLATAGPSTLGTGGYWVKRTAVVPSKLAQNGALAKALWTYSARLTSVNAENLVATSGAPRESAVFVAPVSASVSA